MADCLDKILCEQTSDCDILITNEGGDEVETRYLHDGEIIYLTIEEKEGYHFTGFSYKPYGSDTEYPVTAVLQEDGRYAVEVICGGTYIANYEKDLIHIDVIPDSPLHGTTTGTGDYPENTVVTITATPNNGYNFVEWQINGVAISNNITYQYTVIQNVTIIAIFEVEEYVISTEAQPSTLGTTNGDGTYMYGTSVQLTAVPVNGARFVKWNDGNTNANRNITVTGSAHYIAIFERISVTLTVIIVDENNNPCPSVCGTVTGVGSYNYGDTVTLSETPNIGYEFVSWDNNGVISLGQVLSFIITSNVIVYAKFRIARYRLRLFCDPQNGGITADTNIPPNNYTGGTYVYNTQITAQAIANTNYTFTQWDDGSNQAVKTFIMNQDIDATAYFSRNPRYYTLRINFDSTQGSVSINNGNTSVGNLGQNYITATVIEGTTLTAIVNSIAPCHFASWSDSDPSTTSRTFVMNGDITVTVLFDCTQNYSLCICSQYTQYSSVALVATWVDNNQQQHTHTFTAAQRCISVLGGTRVRVTYTNNDSEHWRFVDWGFNGLGINQYAADSNYVDIDLVDNGELCPTLSRWQKVCLCNPYTDGDKIVIRVRYNNTNYSLVSGGDCVYVPYGMANTITFSLTNPNYEIVSIHLSGTASYTELTSSPLVYICNNMDGDAVICPELTNEKKLCICSSYNNYSEAPVTATWTDTNQTIQTHTFDSTTNRCLSVPIGTVVTVSCSPISGWSFDPNNDWDDTGITTPSTSQITGDDLEVTVNSNVEFCLTVHQDSPSQCTVDFTFEIPGGAELVTNGITYTTDQTNLSVTNGQSFTLNPLIVGGVNHYITDVVENINNNYSSVGTNCSFCYHLYPYVVADSSGDFYYYDFYNGTPPSPSSPATVSTWPTIYDKRWIIDGTDPNYQYVQLAGDAAIDRDGNSHQYAERKVANISSIYSQYDPNTNSYPLFNWLYYNMNFYLTSNPDSALAENTNILAYPASDGTPLMIYSKGTGANGFAIKSKIDCSYNFTCGGKYQICMIKGTYNLPCYEWQPVDPSDVPQGPATLIMRDFNSSPYIMPFNGSYFVDFSEFNYCARPEVAYADGKGYAIVTITNATCYYGLVDACNAPQGCTPVTPPL